MGAEACPAEGQFSGYVMLYPRPKDGSAKGATAASMRRKPAARVWAVLSPTAVRFYNCPITLGGKESSGVNFKVRKGPRVEGRGAECLCGVCCCCFGLGACAVFDQ